MIKSNPLPLPRSETHQLAEAQHRKNEKMRTAFGIAAKEDGEIKEESSPAGSESEAEKENGAGSEEEAPAPAPESDTEKKM